MHSTELQAFDTPLVVAQLANLFLQYSYLLAVDERFARKAAQPEDAPMPLMDGTELRDVFCFKENQVVSRDFVLQFERRP